MDVFARSATTCGRWISKITGAPRERQHRRIFRAARTTSKRRPISSPTRRARRRTISSANPRARCARRCSHRVSERTGRIVLSAYTYTGAGSPTLATRAKDLEFYKAHNRRPRTQAMIDSIFTRDKTGTADPRVPVAIGKVELQYGQEVPTGTYLDMVANLPTVEPAKLTVPVLMLRGEYDASRRWKISSRSSRNYRTATARSQCCPEWRTPWCGHQSPVVLARHARLSGPAALRRVNGRREQVGGARVGFEHAVMRQHVEHGLRVGRA